ncbi:MAG: diguanylate cyclase [Lachnospiraceae bacterium]|nr:diguanylate cyclase [Lachnospiraceae bacterium]
MTSQIKRINRCLILGWIMIVLILLVSYSVEVVKGDRDISYLLAFIAVTFIPAAISTIVYFHWPDNPRMRYYFVTGYFLMYIFVMVTGNTMMVHTYILPMVALIVLYHDPKLVFVSGLMAVLINLAAIILWKKTGSFRLTRDHEIQMAVVFMSFLGSWLATRIYDTIYRVNEEYTNAITAQKEELYQQAEELEAINGQLNEYSSELSEKNEQMRQMTMQTVMTIANTIDAKDEYTRGHSRRVAEYAVAIAKEMGYTERQAEDLRFIGLLHDIGKIGVPDSVLNKPGRLSNEEYQLMKDHTVIGDDILKDITMIDGLDVGAKYHHERYDGSGYPEGLKGEEIPEIARIIGVADAYDAMTSNRIYRKHLEPDRVMEELVNGKGKQFDPKACEIMIRLVEEDRVPRVSMDESKEARQAAQILSRVIDRAEASAMGDMQLDELTGTYNRMQGKNLIQDQIAKYGRGSIYIVDLDGFRKLNETEGFMVGDMYLKAVAEHIRALAKNIAISRFGADEFLVYMPETETAEEAEKVAGNLIEEIRARSRKDERYAKLSVSVGITQIATEKDRLAVAYDNAGKALYVAKQCGGGSYFCHRLDQEDADMDVADSVDLKALVDVLQKREHYKGGYTVAFPEFGKVYDFISSLAERNRQQVHIILFTMRELDGAVITQDQRDTIMGLLEKAIVDSIRNVDATTKYSNVQRVVLLMNLNEKQTRQVINRIMGDFYRMYDKKDVEIHYDSADLSRPAAL